jgi:hypothetical protein
VVNNLCLSLIQPTLKNHFITTQNWEDAEQAKCLLLCRMGPGNLPAVWVQTSQSVLFLLVLPTVQGYPAVVRVWNWTRQSSPGCYMESRGTYPVWGWVRTRPQFNFTVPTTWPPIKYLNSHRIAPWSIYEMFKLIPNFVSHSQICDQINIHWVAGNSSPISR